jgi:regulatory protein
MFMKQSTNSNGTPRPERTTYDRALDVLEARARSVVELRRTLIRKGEPAVDVDAAIERLSANGLLDDANYARQLVRSKALTAGQSRRRIGQELAKRGVARNVADAAIADVFEHEAVDEAAAIERVAMKKLRTLAKLDAEVQRRRLYAFLARRGYGHDEIQRVMRQVLEDSAAGDG